MIFRFTQYAREKLKLPKLLTEPKSENLFNEWFVNVFHSRSRHKFYITTNAGSLFSCVIHGVGVTDEGRLFTDTFYSLRELFKDLDCEFIYERFIAPQKGNIILSNTNNRSVLASMNQLIIGAKVGLDYHDYSPYETSKFINVTPMTAIDWQSPEIYIKKWKG